LKNRTKIDFKEVFEEVSCTHKMSYKECIFLQENYVTPKFYGSNIKLMFK